MRSYHRSTLVPKEGWPLIDGWYWCPESVIKERIKKEQKRLDGWGSARWASGVPWEFDRWKKKQTKLEARLAHACHDGRIRAVSGWGVEYFHTVGGIVRIYGKCRFCDTPLSDGIKTIIIMEREL